MELQLDLMELHGAFAAKPPKAAKPTKNQERRKELLPRGVAQNIAIALARLGASGATDLVEALRALSGDTEVAPALSGSVSEAAARLLDVWPEEKVLAPLLEFAATGNDRESLRDVEKQLLPLVAIPRVHQRLRLLVLAGTAGKRIEEALALLEQVRRAAKQIQNSAFLRELLAIIVLLFNYVNFGSAPPKEDDASHRAPLRGVDVPSLLRLRETKAFKGDFAGFNMLHFVLKQLLRQQEAWEKEKLDEELSSLKRAARVHLDRLHGDLEELQEDFLFVQGELREHRKEYTGLPDTDDEAECHPTQPSNWGFLERLLARGLDLASLAEAWLRGEEVVGRPYHPEVGVFRAFEPSNEAGGRAPPPGWLWLSQPSGRWQRCWSEVRGPILVLYKVDQRNCIGATYAALPGALVSKLPELREEEDAQSALKLEEDGPRESAPSEASTTTTDAGQAPSHTGESSPRVSSGLGFELITAGGSGGRGRLLRLSAATRREAQSWRHLLETVAEQPGAGYLMVSHVVSQGGRSWSKQTLFCAAAHGELSAFSRPRDALEASPPVFSWKLSDFATCRVGFGSFQLRRREGDPAERETWHFTCQDVSDAPRWVELLCQTAPDVLEAVEGCSVPELPAKTLEEARSAAQPCLLRMDSTSLEQAFGPASGRRMGAERLKKALGSEAGEACGSDTTCSDSEAETSCETESIGSSSAMLARNRETEETAIATVSTLPQLEIALARQLRRFGQALEATEVDCQELQCYFGIDAAEWCRKDLRKNSARLLESLSDFVVQIRGAWEDLEKHAQSKHGRLPSETPRKTPRKTSREASSRSSLQPSVQELQTIRPAVASVPQDVDQLREWQRLNQIREWHRLMSMSGRR